MAGKGALILVSGFSLIMGYIVFNLSELGRRATEGVVWYNAATASKNLASIGAHTGLAMIRLDMDWSEPLTQNIVDGVYKGGKFSVSVDETSPGEYILQSISEFPKTPLNKIRDTVEIVFQGKGENDTRMFAWFADINGNAQFYYGEDIIWGPVHSNGGIHLGNIPQGQEVPIFHGRVTAAQNINPVGGDKAKFLGGYDVGKDKIEIPKEFPDLIAASSLFYTPDICLNSGGYNSSDDLYIVLNVNELEIWEDCDPTECGVGSPDITINLTDSCFNGAIYSEGNVSVEGNLSGQVSIGAGRNIIIEGDIRYATNPPYTEIELGMVEGEMRVMYEREGDDLLGLFAGNDVVIADIPGDITVHGVLFALNELVVENYQSRPLADLNIWGSVIMHDRGKIRWQNNGMKQRFKYDTGLEDSEFRPRYFPGWVMNSFEIIRWRESVQKPPF